MTGLEKKILDDRVRRESSEGYYDAAAGEDALHQFQQGKGGTLDDLDNSLYYLLNFYSELVIRQHLAKVARGHPYEVKKRAYAEEGHVYTSERFEGEEDDEEESPEPGEGRPKAIDRRNPLLDKARRLFNVDFKD